jgi:hypothetical protein
MGAMLTVYHNRIPPTTAIAGFDMAISVLDAMPDSDDALKQARAAYDAEASGLEGARFIEVEGMLSDILERAMPYCDLLLLERLSSSEGPDAIALNTALWEGRSPVLVMPPQPATGPMDRIVLSWNGTLQAGRALRAAMPLVANAGSLVVLTRAGKKDTELSATCPLTRYRFVMEGLRQREFRLRLARSLLAEVTDLDAGLSVMGAGGAAPALGFRRATEKSRLRPGYRHCSAPEALNPGLLAIDPVGVRFRSGLDRRAAKRPIDGAPRRMLATREGSDGHASAISSSRLRAKRPKSKG